MKSEKEVREKLEIWRTIYNNMKTIPMEEDNVHMLIVSGKILNLEWILEEGADL